MIVRRSGGKRFRQAVDMTQGSPARLIIAFALPLFIGNLFQQAYSVVDTMIAGYHLGDSAIAAIGATASLYALLLTVAEGMNRGYAIIVTQCFGARDRGRLRRSIAGMIELNIVVTLFVTVLTLTFLRPFLRLMNTPESIFSQACGYMAVISAGMIATIGYNMFSGILWSFGNSRTSLYFLILSSILNTGLDVLFVAVLGLGVAGAAAATVMAQAVSALLCGAYVWKHYRDLLPRAEDFRVPEDLLRDLLASGAAMALTLCVVDIGTVVFQRATNMLGEMFIAAHTISRRIMGILMEPLSTIAIAASTFVGQNWGAKKTERIRSAMGQVIGMEIAWGLFVCLMVYAAGDSMVRLITGTADEDMVRQAVMSLRWHFALMPALGCLFALRMALQAMGRRLVPVLSSFVELGMKVLSALWLIPQLGFLGACVTEPITWVLMLMLLLAVWLSIWRGQAVGPGSRGMDGAQGRNP